MVKKRYANFYVIAMKIMNRFKIDITTLGSRLGEIKVIVTWNPAGNPAPRGTFHTFFNDKLTSFP